MFGKSIIYFDHPVETSVVPDYYNVRACLAAGNALSALLTAYSVICRQRPAKRHCWLVFLDFASNRIGDVLLGRRLPHQVIKRENARDLGLMKNRLLRRKYSSPQGFYDVSQLRPSPPGPHQAFNAFSNKFKKQQS